VTAGEYVALENGELRLTQDEHALQFEPYQGRIYFKDMLLTDIVNIVNKRQGTQTLVLAQDLEDYILTVTFADETPAYIANLICKTLNLSFSYREEVIIIHETQ
jgi:ferric-dicitrate binding protein FerR (iron transport regulator)